MLGEMKYIENQNIWKTCVDALNKLDLSNIQVCHESCCQSNIISKDDEKKVLAEISALATYSYEGDIETGKISQMKLFQMEQNEQIVGSHIFFSRGNALLFAGKSFRQRL